MDSLIYNQKQIPKEQYRYGLRSSAAVGCGWIATWNALCLLGRPETPEAVIRWYEHQLPLIHGNLGTMFFAPYFYFRSHGFPVTFTADAARYDAAAAESQVCILFYHWRKGLRLGAHFVALHRREDGFWAYNTYANSAGPDYCGRNLQAFLKKRGYFGSCLLGIRQKPAP